MVVMRSNPVHTRSTPAVRGRWWCLLVLAACAAPPPETDAVVDDAGRTVTLAGPATRIVSLAPPTTEMLFAIGAGDRLVGRTVWDTDPPEAEAVPSVGDAFPPNLEVILAQNPDLVVFYASEANATAVDRLDRLGIASISIRMDRLESVSRAARRLGRLTGLEVRAERLARQFERSLDSLAAIAWSARPVGVVLTWDNPPIVIGAGSFLSELLALAGARNAFADIPDASPTVTVETIVARDPDFFLLIGGPAVPEWAARPEWQVVEAVREGHFVRLAGTEFSWPSFRAIDAVDRLTRALAAYRDGWP